MTERTGRPWLNYLLGLLCVGAVVTAILVVGPASGSTTTVTRTAKAAEGVVQSTVSGSGNLQAASQLNLGFKTSGTVTSIYVTQGQHVTEGQLLATLNPQSAEVTLEQSKAALQSAEANLAKEEETDGETSTGSGGSGASSGSDGASASAASVGKPSDSTIAATASASASTTPSATPNADSPGATTTPATTAPAEQSPQESPPSTTAPETTTTPATATSPTATSAPTTTSAEPTHTTSSKTVSPQSKGGESRSSGSSSKADESSTPAKAVVSAATREANLASARAAVKSDQLTVQSDEEAVANTKLYAPETGTIVSLSGQVGEVVSASGTTRASSSASSSSGSGSSGSGASVAGGASTAGRSSTGASSSTSSSDSSSSSSSSFAVLSDLSSMQLVVALSESEIGHVKVGQIATVTVEALEGHKLAAHVSEVATLASSSSGVVSYNVTFQLDQMESGLKPGMSATAEVVVKQEEGVNVPTTAISADSVTVVRDGKDVRQRVTTGLAGNTSTILLSGVKAGETVVLPAATSTSSSTSLTSRLSRLGVGGGGGGLGGGAALGGGGGGAFFRGGG